MVFNLSFGHYIAAREYTRLRAGVVELPDEIWSLARNGGHDMNGKIKPVTPLELIPALVSSQLLIFSSRL